MATGYLEFFFIDGTKTTIFDISEEDALKSMSSSGSISNAEVTNVFHRRDGGITAVYMRHVTSAGFTKDKD